MKSIILIGAALGVILCAPRIFSASVNDSLHAVPSPTAAAVDSASSDTLDDTTLPGVPLPPRDSSAEDTGALDSLHGLHLFDSLAKTPPDTLTGRIDSTNPFGLPSDTMPQKPRPAPKTIPPETTATARPPWLYNGLTMEQHLLAIQMLTCFYNFDWNGADKAGRKLLRLEKKKHLPPLGYLLLMGMRVLRVQQGEYESDRERKDLLDDVKKFADKGIELASPDKYPDSCRATCEFLIGGIDGFLATLDIENSPISAALSGFAALKHLQKALSRDSTIADACLGLGLFNCIMAKAPFFVRSALTIIGKNVSYTRGLNDLRICARQGIYAGDIARLYLIQFLSPFWGNEAAEKQEIFHSLERSYPQNPYFVFLDLDENLCFHEQTVFNFTYKSRLKRRITRFKPVEPSAKRYANLVKWQYLLVDPFPGSGIAPDTSLALGNFAYYPLFLQALREKYNLESGGTDAIADRNRHKRYIKALGDEASRKLEASKSMPPSQRNFYLWHIRDGLRIQEK